MKTITITGQAAKSFAPDIIVVSRMFNRLFDTYQEALKELSKATQEAKRYASKAGIDPDNVKTAQFRIEPETDSYRDENKQLQCRLLGYRARAIFKTTLPLDNALLTKLLNCMKDASGEISFSYQLSDSDKAKDELVRLATFDAIHKANIIAESAQVELVSIQSVDYSVKRIRFDCMEYRLYDPDMVDEEYDAPIDITPNDVVAFDGVTMVWEIR